MLQVVLQLGVGERPAKFEEAWNSWEHQVGVNEKFATSKLDDDDVKNQCGAAGGTDKTP